MSIELALRLAANGWPVLPTEASDKRPIGRLVPNGSHDATTNPAIIRQWWAACPDARPAINLEASGLVALDIDVKDPGWRASYDELEPQLTATAQQATPSGGAHALYRCTDPSQVRRLIRCKPGVDLLGKGYVLVYSDSVLASPPAPLPAALATVFREKGPAPVRVPLETVEHDFEPADEQLLAYAHRLALAHGPKAKGEGGNQHAYALGAILRNDLGLSPEETRPILLAWRDAFPETRGWREDYLFETAENGARYATGPRGARRTEFWVAQTLEEVARDLPERPTTAADAPQAAEAPAPAPTDWYTRKSGVSLIRARAHEPWISVGVAGTQVEEVRAGGTVTLQGPTGAGKTSLVCEMILHHCENDGIAAVLSAELTADEFFARMIGIKAGTYWKAVLRGELRDEEMLAALPESLVVADGAGAHLDGLDSFLSGLRASVGSTVTILAAVDYGQIVDAPGEGTRDRVAAVWRALNDIGRRHRAVILVLSQMSRAASKAARGGERLGAEAVDGGAETAAIERWSTLVLEIGAVGNEDADGVREVSLSLAKGRMSGGDMVLPMTYEGRTGRWRVKGEARPAAEVRVEIKERLEGEQAGKDDLAVFEAVRAAHAQGERRAKEGWRLSVIMGSNGKKVSATRIVAALDRMVLDGRLCLEPDLHPVTRQVVRYYVPTHAQPAVPSAV